MFSNKLEGEEEEQSEEKKNKKNEHGIREIFRCTALLKLEKYEEAVD